MGHYPSGPLRGYKTDAWEGGHRVPFIVRWPGVVKPGSQCTQLVHQADLIRTFADALGAPLPDTAGEDSFSLLPLLKGDQWPVRTHAVSCAADGTPAMRKGPWKLIVRQSNSASSRQSDKPRDNSPELLFNLDDDIGERENLASQKPEKVAAMKSLLAQLIREGRSTPGAPQQNDVQNPLTGVASPKAKAKSGK